MDNHWQRLYDIAKSHLSQWERLVANNKPLHTDFGSLRKKYNFPLENVGEVPHWIDKTAHVTQRQLRADLEQLMAKYQIPHGWYNVIWYIVVVGDKSPIGPQLGMGFPEVQIREDGRHEILLDNSVDWDNPIIQKYISDILHKIENESPPQPLPVDDDPRKLDWTPVWEWHKRHPNVSVVELARLLGYDRSYLSRKLSEIDASK